MAQADMSGAAERLAGARRIVLIGTGTSQHAAELGAMMLADAGLDARWSSSATFARWASPPRPGDAAIVISHTAETAFARRVREQILAAGVPLVSITGVGRGWPEAVETVDREQSDTYTVSYAAALTALAVLAQRLGATQYDSERLRATAHAVRAVITMPDIDRIGLPARSMAIIGAGPWAVTAREGALKIREASRTLAEGFEAENLLHGFAVPFDTGDGLILLEPDKDPDGLVAALGRAAEAEGLTVSTLAGPGNDLPPGLAQLPMTVRLQLLAARFARLREQDPDVAIIGAWAEAGLWSLGAPSSLGGPERQARMPEATMHDGSIIEFEVHGDGPTVLLPVDPRPVEGPQADELRKWGADPALGQTLTNGLSDAFRVVAFDYQGHVLRTPKPATLTPANVVKDLLAVADAAGADRFAWYGYSWLAVIGLQLAIRTDRLSALVMGGFPPLNGPYLGMLRVTEASNRLSAAQDEAAARSSATTGGSSTTTGGSDDPERQTDKQPDQDSEWSSVALSQDQTRQFVTFYEALQEFDDRAAQARIACPRLCFVGSADEMQYPPAFGSVHLRLARPIVEGRAELEGLGWDVQVLDGVDHMGAMLPGAVLPILRP